MGIKKGNEQIHREKKYQFMKEQVRPDRKKQAWATCRRLGMLAVTAGIFGGIAGATFLAVKFRFDKTPAKAVKMVSSTPSSTVMPTPSPVRDAVSRGKKMNLSEYSRLSEELAAVGDTLEYSLVGVRGKQGDFKQWHGYVPGSQLSFGLVFQENHRHYYILTMGDAVKGQTSVQVRLADNSVVEGQILGKDDVLNLAVVSVRKEIISDELRQKIEVSSLAGEAQVVNGSKVIAVGAPSGVIGSVMTGSISHDEIAVPILDNELRVFSTDIHYCDQGNGVMLDEGGRVIGVITREFPEYTGKGGLSFVDAASIQETVRFLRKGKKAPYMGILCKTLQESVAQAHELDQGVYVTDVYAKSPAYQGGMRVADVIVQVDGMDIRSMEEIYRILAAHNKKETLVCKVIRSSGKKKVAKTIKIVLG